MIQKLEDLSKEELIKRVRLNAELGMVVNGLWFTAVEEDSDFNRALGLDMDIWKEYGRVAKNRIRKYFNVSSTGLTAVKDFLEYDPWLEVDIQEETPERLSCLVTKYPALEAMEKMGRKTFTCNPREIESFNELVESFDPRIKITALKLPPRKSADDTCCHWLFTLENDG